MIAAALAFVAAGLAATGLVLLLPQGARPLGEAPVMGRFGRTRRGWLAKRPGLAAPTLRALAAVGRRLSPVARLAAPGDLETRIAAAGLAGPTRGPLAGLDARELMAAKLAAAAVAAAFGLLAGAAAPGRLGLVLPVIAPVAGFLSPDLWLVRRGRERARAIRRELPGMLDLLRVTVEAGLPLTAALTEVGERSRGTLGAEWRVVGRETALGMPLAASLRAMLARAPVPEVAALIGSLERALRHGAPLAEALGAQARDARASRARRIREEAARAGPKISWWSPCCSCRLCSCWWPQHSSRR